MNDELKQKLSAYHDGELTETEARKLEQALRDDPQIADGLKQLRALSHLLETAKMPSLSDQGRQRLYAQAELLPQRELTRTVGFLATAAAVVLLVCSLTLWTGERSVKPGNGSSFVLEGAMWLLSEEGEEEAGEQGQLAKWIINDLALEIR